MTASALRVVAFTQGENVPSARFRIRQHIDALQTHGIAMRESPAGFGSYPPAGKLARLPWLLRTSAERLRAVRESTEDLAVFQREMVSTLATAERAWRKPALFDVDDAIWLHQRFGAIARIARRCGHVVCGNSFLAEWFAKHAQVTIIPTAVDTDYYRPGVRSETPLLCWSGSASGLVYLQAMEDALARVLDAVPEARLRVISNAAPRFTSLPAARVEYVPWSPQNEVGAIQAAWAGLMPMPDTTWTRGKCSFKMLTYMSCGVPAVVSPFGMNAEVLGQGGGAFGAANDAAWSEVLVELLRTSATQRDAIGAAGRTLVQRHYARDVIAARLAGVMKSLC